MTLSVAEQREWPPCRKEKAKPTSPEAWEYQGPNAEARWGWGGVVNRSKSEELARGWRKEMGAEA